MKKKSSRIFFVSVMLLLFLFGNFGSFILYHLSEELNRNQLIRQLKNGDDGELIKLAISYTELHNKNIFQQQEEDEIVYKGHLYDVARKNAEHDGIVFYCINDSKEEMLNAELNDNVKSLFDQTTPGKTSPKSSSIKTLQEYLTITPLDFNSLNNGISVSFSESVTSFYGAVYPDVFTPPPAFG